MVATLSLRVMTGAGATTVSSAQSGISFLAIDSAANDIGTRQSNPIVVGQNSMEKHLRLYIDVAPNSSVSNFRFWTDGVGATNVGLKYRTTALGTGGPSPGTGDAQPVNTAMSGTDAYTATAANPVVWDNASYATSAYVTRALILQLQPTSGATPGAWPQELLYLSYDEA